MVGDATRDFKSLSISFKNFREIGDLMEYAITNLDGTFNGDIDFVEEILECYTESVDLSPIKALKNGQKTTFSVYGMEKPIIVERVR